MSVRLVLASLVFGLFGSVASAQSFEEVLSAAQAQVGDMSKYQQALQNPDPRMQYAFVQQMLKLDDPALQRIAKEHALFSTNPVMREAAIKAILDSGTTLRLQLAAERTKAESISNWVTNWGGVYLEQQGQLLLRIPPALNADCWGSNDRCQFRLVGNALQFKPYVPNNDYFSAVLNLGNDGVLRGSLTYRNREFSQVQIDLKE